jgi:hypothetical protein
MKRIGRDPLSRARVPRWADVDIADDTPLRLAEAAAIAFPTGSMTASGLRREAARGRLIVERIAGKDFTTLAAIRRMRELCRADQNRQGSTCESQETTTAMQHGSSLIAEGKSALARVQQISKELRQPSQRISREKQNRTSAPVIPLKS